jgi:hypothetical protein
MKPRYVYGLLVYEISHGSFIIAPKKVVYSDALDLYVGCSQFESRLWHQLFWPRSLWFSSVLPGERRDRPPNPLSFIRLQFQYWKAYLNNTQKTLIVASKRRATYTSRGRYTAHIKSDITSNFRALSPYLQSLTSRMHVYSLSLHVYLQSLDNYGHLTES